MADGRTKLFRVIPGIYDEENERLLIDTELGEVQNDLSVGHGRPVRDIVRDAQVTTSELDDAGVEGILISMSNETASPRTGSNIGNDTRGVDGSDVRTPLPSGKVVIGDVGKLDDLVDHDPAQGRPNIKTGAQLGGAGGRTVDVVRDAVSEEGNLTKQDGTALITQADGKITTEVKTQTGNEVSKQTDDAKADLDVVIAGTRGAGTGIKGEKLRNAANDGALIDGSDQITTDLKTAVGNELSGYAEDGKTAHTGTTKYRDTNNPNAPVSYAAGTVVKNDLQTIQIPLTWSAPAGAIDGYTLRYAVGDDSGVTIDATSPTIKLSADAVGFVIEGISDKKYIKTSLKAYIVTNSGLLYSTAATANIDRTAGSIQFGEAVLPDNTVLEDTVDGSIVLAGGGTQTELDRLRQGQMPNDAGESLESETGAQGRADEAAGTGAHLIANTHSYNSSGGYHANAGAWGVYITVDTKVHIGRVLINSSGVNTGTLQLVTDPAGTVLKTKALNLVNGLNWVTVDWTIPAGDYHFGLSSAGWTGVGAYRNNSGAAFPYDNGSFHITDGGQFGQVPNHYYYYFYDFEIGGADVEGRIQSTVETPAGNLLGGVADNAEADLDVIIAGTRGSGNGIKGEKVRNAANDGALIDSSDQITSDLKTSVGNELSAYAEDGKTAHTGTTKYRQTGDPDPATGYAAGTVVKNDLQTIQIPLSWTPPGTAIDGYTLRYAVGDTSGVTIDASSPTIKLSADATGYVIEGISDKKYIKTTLKTYIVTNTGLRYSTAVTANIDRTSGSLQFGEAVLPDNTLMEDDGDSSIRRRDGTTQTELDNVRQGLMPDDATESLESNVSASQRALSALANKQFVQLNGVNHYIPMTDYPNHSDLDFGAYEWSAEIACTIEDLSEVWCELIAKSNTSFSTSTAGWNLSFHGSSGMAFGIGNAGVNQYNYDSDFETKISAGELVHIGIRMESGVGLKMFLNGKHIHTYANYDGIDLSAPSEPFTIGGNAGYNSGRFGKINVHRVRAFNIGLSDAEMAELVYLPVHPKYIGGKAKVATDSWTDAQHNGRESGTDFFSQSGSDIDITSSSSSWLGAGRMHSTTKKGKYRFKSVFTGNDNSTHRIGFHLYKDGSRINWDPNDSYFTAYHSTGYFSYKTLSGSGVKTTDTIVDLSAAPDFDAIHFCILSEGGTASPYISFDEDDVYISSLGCVLEYLPENIDAANNMWRDSSGNGHDGTIAGAYSNPAPPIHNLSNAEQDLNVLVAGGRGSADGVKGEKIRNAANDGALIDGSDKVTTNLKSPGDNVLGTIADNAESDLNNVVAGTRGAADGIKGEKLRNSANSGALIDGSDQISADLKTSAGNGLSAYAEDGKTAHTGTTKYRQTGNPNAPTGYSAGTVVKNDLQTIQIPLTWSAPAGAIDGYTLRYAVGDTSGVTIDASSPTIKLSADATGFVIEGISDKKYIKTSLKSYVVTNTGLLYSTAVTANIDRTSGSIQFGEAVLPDNTVIDNGGTLDRKDNGGVTLDKLSDGGTYKKTTENQRDGGGYAHTGLDNSGVVKLDVPLTHAAKNIPTIDETDGYAFEQGFVNPTTGKKAKINASGELRRVDDVTTDWNRPMFASSVKNTAVRVYDIDMYMAAASGSECGLLFNFSGNSSTAVGNLLWFNASGELAFYKRSSSSWGTAEILSSPGTGWHNIRVEVNKNTPSDGSNNIAYLIYVDGSLVKIVNTGDSRYSNLEGYWGFMNHTSAARVKSPRTYASTIEKVRDVNVKSLDASGDFTGDAKGSVAGVSATTVKDNAADGKTSHTETAQFRGGTAPNGSFGDAGTPRAAVQNDDGSVKVSINWTYTPGANKHHGFILEYDHGTGSTQDPATGRKVKLDVGTTNYSVNIPQNDYVSFKVYAYYTGKDGTSRNAGYAHANWTNYRYASEVVLPVGLFPALPDDTALIGHWNLDEGSGTVVNDVSGRGYHGTAVNMEDSSWKPGKSGMALEFDGVNEHVLITDDAHGGPFPNGLTISAWIKPYDAVDATWQCAVHRGDDSSVGGSTFFIGIASNTAYITGTIGANTGIGYDDGITDVVAADNTWYHVVSTWDGTNVRIYVDSVLKVTYALSAGSWLTEAGKLVIGGSYNESGYDWEGLVDEVRIYATDVSASEVKALFLNPGGQVSLVDVETRVGSQVRADGAETNAKADTTARGLSTGGDFTGNVDGVAASTVKNNAADGKTAHTGTTKYRSVTNPNDPVSYAAGTVVKNDLQTIQIPLTWTAPAGSIDGYTLRYAVGDTSGVTIDASSPTIKLSADATGFVIEGISDKKYIKTSLKAYIVTNTGLLYSNAVTANIDRTGGSIQFGEGALPDNAVVDNGGTLDRKDGGGVTLDKLNDGTTYKKTTTNQRDGGGRGYNALTTSYNLASDKKVGGDAGVTGSNVAGTHDGDTDRLLGTKTTLEAGVDKPVSNVVGVDGDQYHVKADAAVEGKPKRMDALHDEAVQSRTELDDAGVEGFLASMSNETSTPRTGSNIGNDTRPIEGADVKSPIAPQRIVVGNVGRLSEIIDHDPDDGVPHVKSGALVDGPGGRNVSILRNAISSSGALRKQDKSNLIDNYGNVTDQVRVVQGAVNTGLLTLSEQAETDLNVVVAGTRGAASGIKGEKLRNAANDGALIDGSDQIAAGLKTTAGNGLSAYAEDGKTAHTGTTKYRETNAPGDPTGYAAGTVVKNDLQTIQIPLTWAAPAGAIDGYTLRYAVGDTSGVTIDASSPTIKLSADATGFVIEGISDKKYIKTALKAYIVTNAGLLYSSGVTANIDRTGGTLEFGEGLLPDTVKWQFPSDENLVGHWSFDDIVNGTAKDSSPNGNHATVGGNIGTVQGVSGRGVSATYADATQYITVLDDTAAGAFENKWLLSMWFRSDITTGDSAARLIGRDASDYWSIIVQQDESGPQDIQWYWDEQNSTIIDDVVTVGQWHHLLVASSKTDSLSYMYVDGVLIKTISQAHTFLTTSRPIVMFCNTEDVPNATSDPFQGAADEVRFYSDYDITKVAEYAQAFYKFPAGPKNTQAVDTLAVGGREATILKQAVDSSGNITAQDGTQLITETDKKVTTDLKTPSNGVLGTIADNAEADLNTVVAGTRGSGNGIKGEVLRNAANNGSLINASDQVTSSLLTPTNVVVGQQIDNHKDDIDGIVNDPGSGDGILLSSVNVVGKANDLGTMHDHADDADTDLTALAQGTRSAGAGTLKLQAPKIVGTSAEAIFDNDGGVKVAKATKNVAILDSDGYEWSQKFYNSQSKLYLKVNENGEYLRSDTSTSDWDREYFAEEIRTKKMVVYSGTFLVGTTSTGRCGMMFCFDSQTAGSATGNVVWFNTSGQMLLYKRASGSYTSTAIATGVASGWHQVAVEVYGTTPNDGMGSVAYRIYLDGELVRTVYTTDTEYTNLYGYWGFIAQGTPARAKRLSADGKPVFGYVDGISGTRSSLLSSDGKYAGVQLAEAFGFNLVVVTSTGAGTGETALADIEDTITVDGETYSILDLRGLESNSGMFIRFNVAPSGPIRAIHTYDNGDLGTNYNRGSMIYLEAGGVTLYLADGDSGDSWVGTPSYYNSYDKINSDTYDFTKTMWSSSYGSYPSTMKVQTGMRVGLVGNSSDWKVQSISSYRDLTPYFENGINLNGAVTGTTIEMSGLINTDASYQIDNADIINSSKEQTGAFKTRAMFNFGISTELLNTGSSYSTVYLEAKTVNGVTNGYGYRVPMDCKVVGMSFQATVTENTASEAPPDAAKIFLVDGGTRQSSYYCSVNIAANGAIGGQVNVGDTGLSSAYSFTKGDTLGIDIAVFKGEIGVIDVGVENWAIVVEVLI